VRGSARPHAHPFFGSNPASGDAGDKIGKPGGWLRRSRSSFIFIFLVAVSVALITALGWVNYHFSESYTGVDDFAVYWASTRALLTQGASPYDPIVRQLIPPSREVSNVSQVTYPAYAFIVFLPFALIGEYILARAAWMTTLEVALLLFVFAGLRLTRWRTHPLLVVFFFLASFFSIHGLLPIVMGNVVIVVSLAIAYALLAVRSGYDEAAGVLLALATIKPLFAALITLFILVWAITHRRWRLVVWYIGSLALFTFGTLFFVPSWPLQYIQTVIRLPQPALPQTPGDAFKYWWPGIGDKLGWTFTALLAIILLVEWGATLSKDEYRRFLWTSCLTLVVSQLIGIRTQPTNFIILTLPFVLICATLEERWKIGGRVTSTLLLITWITLPWWIYLRLLEAGNTSRLIVLLFPLPTVLFIGLYWVRWWAVKTKRTLLETLRVAEEA
jgi:hypothetical protein